MAETWTPPVTVPPAGGVLPSKDSALFLPSRTVVGGAIKHKALINIIGTSGVGKSFLVSQALDDPDYGPEEVMVLMHEAASMPSYGPKIKYVCPVTTPDTVLSQLEELAEAAAKGKRLAKLIFWDSLTGMTDYFQKDKSENPNMVWNEDKKMMVRDKRSEFGDMGGIGRDIYLLLRDEIPSDIVVLITSYEDNFSPRPEIACEGKIIPKNVTRWSSCTLYMKSQAGKAEIADIEEEIRKGAPAHRSYGTDATGRLDGTFASRYFIAQNTGEIMAKGHRNLGLQERAILPDVLRKIHGTYHYHKA